MDTVIIRGTTIQELTGSCRSFGFISASPLTIWRLRVHFANDAFDSDFSPIAPLNRSDADVVLLALYNYAMYSQPVTDPWFQGIVNVSNRALGISNAGQSYLSNDNVTFLGTTTQYQFCYSSDFAQSCTPLRGFYQNNPYYFNSSYHNFTGFNLNQRATAGLLTDAISLAHYSNTVISQGATILNAYQYVWQASGFTRLSSGLPSMQWKTEAFNFHNITLAGLQRVVLERPAPQIFDVRPGVSSLPFIDLQTLPADARLCGAQKIRNPSYTSFSVLGLSLIIGIGGLIIAINFVISDIVFFVRRRFNRSQYKRIDWITGETLHLQRMVLESHGVGPWKGGEAVVPVVNNFDKRYSLMEPEAIQLQDSPGEERIHAKKPQPKHGYVSIPINMV